MDCIFFFKQKTAYEMRISDWSSDVCSSDLVDLPHHAFHPPGARLERADLVSRPPRLPGRAPRHQRRKRGYLMAATTQAAFEDISQPAPQSVRVNGNDITAQAVLA